MPPSRRSVATHPSAESWLTCTPRRIHELKGVDMKNENLSPATLRSVATVIIFLVGLPILCLAQTKVDQRPAAATERKKTEDIFGFPGVLMPGDVIRFN